MALLDRSIKQGALQMFGLWSLYQGFWSYILWSMILCSLLHAMDLMKLIANDKRISCSCLFYCCTLDACLNSFLATRNDRALGKHIYVCRYNSSLMFLLFSIYKSSVPLFAIFSQDMQDMRNCYDTLLSAAAATANSAYGT